MITCPECHTSWDADGPRVACPECGAAGSSSEDGRSDAFTSAVRQFEEDSARAGRAPDVDEFCERHPSVRERLSRALRLSLRLQEISRASSSMVSAIPERLGPYRLLGELGRGGMAPVHLARDERLGRDVALKLFDRTALHGASRRERFLREARALASIDHPNVVPIHDIGEDDRFCYIAMERMAGSLADPPGPSPVPGEERERIRTVAGRCLDAARGLVHAHALGILHRDIKPSNVLLGSDGRVRVGDFGLARIEAEDSLTATGQAVGTMAYASPEQCRGERVDARSDVYGLGATLYHLLSGTAPPPALTVAARALPFPPSVPRALRDVVRMAMARSPSKRHRDMGAMAAALDSWLAGRARSGAGLRARVIAGVAGLAAAVALVVQQVGMPTLAGKGGGAAAPMRDPGLPGGFIALRLVESTFDSLRLPEPMRSGPTWEDLSTPRDALDSPTFEHEGRVYQVRMDPDRPVLTLHRGGGVAARFELESTSGPPASGSRGPWRPSVPPMDLDGDGRPDVAMTDGAEVVIVKWDLAAWGTIGAWDVKVHGRFRHSSPTVDDWDGDGRLEVLIGDAGPPAGDAARIASTLYEIDLGTGAIDRTWALDGHVNSTPQLLRDARGRVASMYLDTAGYGRDGGYLYRFDPASPDVVSRLANEGDRPLPFSWPVFEDVDRDGTKEVLFVRGQTEIVCMRSDLRGPPLWTQALPSESYAEPLLSPQDSAAPDEICFGSNSRFDCWRTAAGLAEADRLAWAVPLPYNRVFFNQAVSLGDLDGDGLPELASGSNQGDVDVFGAGAPGHHLLSLAIPVAARELPRGNTEFYVARLAPRSLDDGSVALVGATTGGWVHAWRVTADAAAWQWSYNTGKGIEATPRWVWIAPARGEPRWYVLVYAASGFFHLLEPASDPSSQPRCVWSSAISSGTSTPAILQEEGGPWVVFATFDGHVVRMPIRLSS